MCFWYVYIRSLVLNDAKCVIVIPAERCVYRHYLNYTQSSDIVCSSRFMYGSHYYHTVVRGAVAEKPMDIIHCEASTNTLMLLNVYADADKDGLKLLTISSVPCVFINSTSCTCVDLYLNLSHFDQHNDSTIPICGYTRQEHNLECFCIHYILGEILWYSIILVQLWEVRRRRLLASMILTFSLSINHSHIECLCIYKKGGGEPGHACSDLLECSVRPQCQLCRERTYHKLRWAFPLSDSYSTWITTRFV